MILSSWDLSSNTLIILHGFLDISVVFFLKPTGSCFIAVPNGESLHRRIGHAAGLLPDMLTLGKGDRALGHQRQYSVDLLTDQLNECDYSVIRKEGIFLKPLMTGQLRTLNLSKEILRGMCKVGMEYPELSAALFFEATPNTNKI